MTHEETLLLTKTEVARLLGVEECIAAVENMFRLYGEGKTRKPGILGIHSAGGGFHIKAGLMDLNRSYFVAKVNANFPENRRFGLPTIQGVIIVCDGSDGRPLAVMDSIEITILRTGAATAIPAKYLSREDSRVVTVFGCGNQGKISLRMLSKVRPVEKAFVFDIEQDRAEFLAAELSKELSIDIEPAKDISKMARHSDIVVTCTPAKRFFLRKDHVRPGTFIAAVGADSEEKHELDPELLRESIVIADITEQAATIGELHHAIDAGLMTRDNVYGELGEIVSGAKLCPSAGDSPIVYDSTGMALQDVAAAAVVYEKALSEGAGQRINFSV